MEKAQTQELNVQEYYSPSGDNRPRHTGLITVVAVLVMLAVAGFVLHNQLFRIREVRIDSVRHVPEYEVLALAGINQRTSSMALNEKKIAEGINSHMYLEYKGLEKVSRNQIILYVHERQIMANVLYNGLQYRICEDGMVIDCSARIALDNGNMTVSGLNIRDIRIGSVLTCHAQEQLDAYKAVTEEICLQGIKDEIAELNFSSLDSIYLVTVDGYTVNIGTNDDLQGKIGTMRAVIGELRSRGLKGGIVEATVSGIATYRPTE